MTKCHRLGGLLNRNLLVHNFGGCDFKTMVLAWFGSSESSLPGSQMTIFTLCAHMASPVYRWVLISGQPEFALLIPVMSSLLPSEDICLVLCRYSAIYFVVHMCRGQGLQQGKLQT